MSAETALPRALMTRTKGRVFYDKFATPSEREAMDILRREEGLSVAQAAMVIIMSRRGEGRG